MNKLSVIITLWAVPLLAQPAAIPAPWFNAQFFNNSTGVSLPCAGCKLYTYAAGTTTPLATYTDYTGTTTNPVIITLDSSGYAGTGIFMRGVCYKISLKTPSLVTIKDQDYVCGDTLKAALASPTGSNLVGFSQVGGVAETVQQELRRTVTPNQFGADPSSSPAVNVAALVSAFSTSSNVVMGVCGTYSIGAGIVYIARGTSFDGWPQCVEFTTTGNGGFVFLDPYRQVISLRTRRETIDWPTTDSTSIGVTINGTLGAQENTFKLTVSNYNIGVLLTTNFGDITENYFPYVELQDCKIGWDHRPSGGHGINQNTFIKFTARINSGATCPAGSPIAGSKYIYLETGSNNNNVWVNPELQGQCVQKSLDDYGRNNLFISPRFEANIAGAVTFQAGTYGNKLINPYTDTGRWSPSIVDLGQNGDIPINTGPAPSFSGSGFGTGATITGLGAVGKIVTGSAATSSFGVVTLGTPFPTASVCSAQDLDAGTYLPVTGNSTVINIFATSGNLPLNHNVWFLCTGW